MSYVQELHERIIDGMRHLLQDRLSTQLLAIVEQLATQYHKYDESNEFSALVKGIKCDLCIIIFL